MAVGSSNGNWKGGISRIKHVDDLLLPCYEQYALVLKEQVINSVSHSGSTDCWIWNQKVSRKEGRARLTIGRTATNAARAVYVLFKKEPVGTQYVCHNCDNVLCVNPAHLWLGKQSDNMTDMVSKGRANRPAGSRNPNSKITEEIVKYIRSCRKPVRDLTEELKLSRSQIYSILRGDSWEHAGI